MKRPLLWSACLMLLTWSAPAEENPWVERAPALIAAAERDPGPANLRAGLDAAYRADDWQAGQRLAKLAVEQPGGAGDMRGLAARAAWRAGQIEAAEALVADLPPNPSDPVALEMQTLIALAHGDLPTARTAAQRLEQIAPDSATAIAHVLAVRFEEERLGECVPLVERLGRVADASHGYPEHYLLEEFGGVAKFLRAVGPQPINEIQQFGAAEMAPIPLLGLPRCRAMVNGHGPFTFVVDTGGSIVLSLDKTIAEQINLPLLAEAHIRGVSGKDTSQQALLDELRIGEIVCQRVMTRVFDVKKATLNACDGILGLGVLADGRVTLDFAGAALHVAPSSAAEAEAEAVPIRIIGDAKIISPITVENEPATCLWDSGADGVYLSPVLLTRRFPGREFKRVSPAEAGVQFPGGVGGGAIPAITLAPAVDLELGRRVYKDAGGIGLDVLDEIFGPLLGVQIDVLVGMPIFRDTQAVVIDYPQRKMWIRWLPR